MHMIDPDSRATEKLPDHNVSILPTCMLHAIIAMRSLDDFLSDQLKTNLFSNV